ncbi:MAG: NAD(P)/FAD-dependent oxidoreductase, partial [Planctomycetota bacterium]
MRKRSSRFTWGSYGFWRAAHGVLGVSVMIAIGIHTGMQLGSNLNWVLGVCFLSAGVLGGLAGIASSLESRLGGSLGMKVRRWRPHLASLHLWVTWPLPLLIGLHIFSFYLFR